LKFGLDALYFFGGE